MRGRCADEDCDVKTIVAGGLMVRPIRLQHVWAMMLLHGVVSATPTGAQSLYDGATEAVRAARASTLVRDWDAAFATASGSSVLASFAGVRDSTGALRDTLDTSVAARIRASLGGGSYRLIPSQWRCADVPLAFRAECALEDQPYFIEVGGPRQRGDTAIFYVGFAKRATTSKRADRLLIAVHLVRDGSGWRAVQVSRGM